MPKSPKNTILNALKKYCLKSVSKTRLGKNHFRLVCTFGGIIQSGKNMTINQLAALVEKGFNDLKAEVLEIKTDVAVLKTDVAALKTDVAELKTDVAELKTDVAQLKTDVAQLKTDVAEHSKILAEHSKILAEHSAIFKRNNLK